MVTHVTRIGCGFCLNLITQSGHFNRNFFGHSGSDPPAAESVTSTKLPANLQYSILIALTLCTCRSNVGDPSLPQDAATNTSVKGASVRVGLGAIHKERGTP